MKQPFESAGEIIRNLPVGVYRASLEKSGQFLDVNPALVSALDAESKAELVDHSILDFYQDPADRSGFLDQLEADGQIYEKEIAVESLTGREFLASVTATIHDDSYYGIFQDIESQEALKSNYKSVFDAINDSVFVHTLSGQFVLVNETAIEQLGYTESELLSMGPADVDSPDTEIRTETRIQQISDEDQLTFESVHVTKDGTEIPVEINAREIEFLGQPHVVSVARDISRRKEQKRELAAREQKYRTLFEDSRDALMLFDRDGYLDCNQQALELFGVDSVEAFVDYSPWELSPPTQPDGSDSKEAALERIDEAFEEGEAFFKWTHQRVDGTEFPAEVKISRFEYESKQVVQALVRDITERKAQKRQLEAREQKYRNLFENTRDALMLLDRDGFFDCNQRTLELFGIDSVEAFVDYSPWELSPPTQPDGSDSKEVALKHVETAFEEGEAFFEWTHQRVDGTEFPAEVKLSRFEHEGEPALHGLVREITERKEYQRQIEQQRDDLNTLNQVLRHDIRNDLQLVTSYAELLADECATVDNQADRDVKQYIETIRKRAAHSVELTTTAREMADTMLTGGEELQAVNLRSILESELDEVHAAYPDAVVTTESVIPSTEVQANDMLGSVFQNLLKNGIQHNDSEIPRVNVSVSESETDVLVRIADNGPGVPDEQKETIFGKGEKGLDSQGSGIGLYLVESLVTTYGGTIWIEDNDPEGSVFVVELRKSS